MRHQRVKRTDVCKHWLRSQCKKGDQCEYLHQYDMTRMPLCHFFADGQCTKDDCQFLHIRPEDKVVECPWYARGFCKHGPKCRKKHVRKELCGSYMAGFCPKGAGTDALVASCKPGGSARTDTAAAHTPCMRGCDD